LLWPAAAVTHGRPLFLAGGETAHVRFALTNLAPVELEPQEPEAALLPGWSRLKRISWVFSGEIARLNFANRCGNTR
jgi:hypothetical protein